MKWPNDDVLKGLEEAKQGLLVEIDVDDLDDPEKVKELIRKEDNWLEQYKEKERLDDIWQKEHPVLSWIRDAYWDVRRFILNFWGDVWYFLSSDLWHRIKYGYPRKDIWGLDVTLAKWIVPRLKELKEHTYGISPEFNDLDEWFTVLNQIIWSFEAIASDEWDDWEHSRFMIEQYSAGNYSDNSRYDKPWELDFTAEFKLKTMHEGLDLFRKYYFYLND